MARENFFRGFKIAPWSSRLKQRVLFDGSLLGAQDLGDKRTPNLPMMSEGINHAAESPTVFLPHRNHLRCTSRQRLPEDGIRIRNR
jgi:hypothetical protein